MRALNQVGVPVIRTPSPQTWDNLASLGTWDYVARIFASWDDLYFNRQQPVPTPPIPGPQAGVTPDLAGLSLAGAYQAGLAAGYTNFQVVAYRQSYMSNPEFLYLEAAPAVGYVAQTTSPGTGGGGAPGPNTPPQGSFFTLQPTPGVADQSPNPGTPVSTNGTLSFVFQVGDDRPQPNDVQGWVTDGPDAQSGTWVYWRYTFPANNVPSSLQDSMNIYNTPPMTPVDVTSAEWPLVAQDPLVIFTAPPLLAPEDLLSEVPPFEQGSYEIATVLRVVANELARIEAAQQALTQQWFPSSADVLLARFEAMLGLPEQPLDGSGNPVPLDVRRSLVLAYMQRLRTEGTGLDWIASMNALAGNAWNYQEHNPADPASPPAYTIAVNIPQVFATVGWNYVRGITPAHIAITEGYTGGWLVGIADLDQDNL
jgi:hypothetical protein